MQYLFVFIDIVIKKNIFLIVLPLPDGGKA